MSIEPRSASEPLVPQPPPEWGEVAPDGQTAQVVRFVLDERVVSYPVDQFRSWVHDLGFPETLTIRAGREQVIIEGAELAPIRMALDLGRLCELRVVHSRKRSGRPGPQVRRITVEPA